MRKSDCQRLVWPMLLLIGSAGCSVSGGGNPDIAGQHQGCALAIDAGGDVVVAWSVPFGAQLEKWSSDRKLIYTITLESHAAECSVGALAVDEDFIYCAVQYEKQPSFPIHQQIRRFRLSDGAPAPFAGKGQPAVDEWIELDRVVLPTVTEATTEPSRRIVGKALRGMDIAGSTLYVADSLAGRMWMLDTSTGRASGGFDVHLPHAVAVDPLGQIWVAHDHDTVTVYRADGYSGPSYGGLGEVTSLAFGPGAKLYATDSAGGRVLSLETVEGTDRFVPLLGSKAKAGDEAADRFFDLRGVAADGAGNLMTVDRRAASVHVVKWSADKKLLWEKDLSTTRQAGRK